MEYRVRMVSMVAEGTSSAEVETVRAAEAVDSAELAKSGHLVRLWRPPLGPGEWRSIGLLRAADEPELREVLTRPSLGAAMDTRGNAGRRGEESYV
jgi:muconolactone D-isomerase